jgi:capsular exopolysaccharide synthesis family protein
MGSQSTRTSPSAGASDTNQPAFSTAVTDTTLSDALITLRKRKLVVIGGLLLGLAYGIYKAETQPRMYEAFGRIQVRSGSSNEYRVNAVQAYTGDSTGSRMLTEVAILESDTLMLTVAREMDLANNPDFLDGKAPSPRASLDDPRVRQDVVHRLQSGLRIMQVQKTDIIRISYSSLSPKLAADIVNKVISAYIQRSYETRFASTQRVSNWLSSQLDDLKQQVQSSQEQLMDLQKRLGILGIDPSSHSQITSSIEQLSKAANDAHIARIIAESRYRMLNDMDPNTIEGSIETVPGTAPAELNILRGQIATAKAAYAQMESTFGPNHPQAKAQKAQIDELAREINSEQQRLLLQAKETYLAARTNEEQTSAAVDVQKADAYKMRDDLVEYTLRQREFESNRSLYEGLLQRLRTASVQAGLESLEIDVVDQAALPAAPVLRPQSTIILTMIFFGLLASVILSFLLESLDTGLRSVAEIENITELPSLAIIPRSRRQSADQSMLSAAERNISSLAQPKSQFAEAFRSLRTALLLSMAGQPPKFILFTSATPSEGKTTAASNLAVILAQGSSRVLLIDADLRRPNVHHRFGLSARVGLTTLLTGATTLDQTVQNVSKVPNLDVLASGPVPPFPTEMLSSDAMNNLLDECGKLYTHVIIDSPPILSVTDAVILAREADAVVLVVRHGKSSKHVVRRARDLLLRSGSPITGILLNAVDMNSPEYYGYYGYSGYSYAGVDADSWESKSVSAADNEVREEVNQ